MYKMSVSSAASRKSSGSVISAAGRMVIAARRALSAQRPVVINKNTTIGTNFRWANAVEIGRRSGWAAPLEGESYVWGKRDPNGPAAAVARRILIRFPKNRIQSATLFLSVDNFAIVFINGRPVLVDNPQSKTSFFDPGRRLNIERFLRRGRNDIVILAYNFPSYAKRKSSNPAGVLARIEIQFKRAAK